MNTYMVVDIQVHVLLARALGGGEWTFNPGETALSSHWIGRWVGSRAGILRHRLNYFQRLCHLDLRISVPHGRWWTGNRSRVRCLYYRMFCSYCTTAVRQLRSERVSQHDPLQACKRSWRSAVVTPKRFIMTLRNCLPATVLYAFVCSFSVSLSYPYLSPLLLSDNF
jgi:hypothetical protein